jgi:hypothetical protein
MYYKMHPKPLGCCWEKNLQIVTIKISEVMWLLCHTSLGTFLPNMVNVCSMFPMEFLCKSWPLMSVISDRHQSTNIDDRNINIKFHFTHSMVPPPQIDQHEQPFHRSCSLTNQQKLPSYVFLLNPTISWREQVSFQWGDDDVRFVLDQHA